MKRRELITLNLRQQQEKNKSVKHLGISHQFKTVNNLKHTSSNIPERGRREGNLI